MEKLPVWVRMALALAALLVGSGWGAWITQAHYEARTEIQRVQVDVSDLRTRMTRLDEVGATLGDMRGDLRALREGLEQRDRALEHRLGRIEERLERGR